MVRRRRFLLTALAAAGCAAQKAAGPTVSRHVDAPADLVVRGGTIVTHDEATPRVEAIAARDGVVIAIGKEALDPRFVGSRTRVLDLAGGTATPGLVDAHAHLVGVTTDPMRCSDRMTTGRRRVVTRREVPRTEEPPR